MKNSMRKVMSLALALVMVFSLLIPTTFVSAEVTQKVVLSFVNAAGKPVNDVYKSTNDLYLRIAIEGWENVYAMTISVEAANIKFVSGTSPVVSAAANHRYSENSLLNGKKVISSDNGFVVSDNAAAISFADAPGQEVLVNLAGAACNIVDLKIAEVTGNVGDDISVTFVSGKANNNVQTGTGSLTKVDVTDASKVVANALTKKIADIPYKVTDVDITSAEEFRYPATVEEDFDKDAFVDKLEALTVNATMDQDKDATPGNDVVALPVYVEGVGTEPSGIYAKISAATLTEFYSKLTTPSTEGYDIAIEIVSPANDPTDAVLSQSIKVYITNADSKTPAEYKLNPDAAAIDVVYAASETTIKETIIAAFNNMAEPPRVYDVLTDDSEVGTTLDFTGDDTFAVTGVDSRVLGASTANIASTKYNVNGTIAVNVLPVTVTDIEATVTGYTNKPATTGGPAVDTDFLAALSFMPVYDTATYDAENTAFEILSIKDAEAFVDEASMVADKVYVDFTNYKPDVAGDYALDTWAKLSVMGADAEPVKGTVTITVDPAVPTTVLKLDTTVAENLFADEFEGDAPTADDIGKVKAMVDDEIYKGLVKVVMTDSIEENVASDKVTVTSSVEWVVPVDGSDPYYEVTFAAEGYTFPDGAKISVPVGAPTNITEIVSFVNSDGAAPAVSAKLAKYVEAGESAGMVWDDVTVTAKYLKPGVEEETATAADYKERTYYYQGSANATAARYFVVEGWQDYEERKAKGKFDVTVKIYDSSRLPHADSTEEDAFAYVETLKEAAEITAAEPTNKIIFVPVSFEYKVDEINAANALNAVLTANHFKEIYKDGTTKDTAIKVGAANWTSDVLNGAAAGTYSVTVTGIDAATNPDGKVWVTSLDDITPVVAETGTLNVVVKKKSSSSAPVGVVVGGGGVSGGSGTTVKPPVEDPEDPTEPTDPVDPVDPEDPTEPTDPDAPVIGADIPEGHFAAEPVRNMIKKGIISGDQNGNVNIDAKFNRAQMAKILALLDNGEANFEGGVIGSITDSDEVPEWSNMYVKYVVDNKIMNGLPDGSFNAHGVVSRVQLAAAILRVYGFGEGDGSNLAEYTDIATGHWGVPALSKCVELGIMSGYGNGIMRPDGEVTTGEACTMIDRAVKLYEALQEAVTEDAE